MDGMNQKRSRVAEGYTFYTEKDADLAELERKKIEYLESRMDYSHPENILRVYNKAIHERIFKTPVGILYLKKMQEYLLRQDTIDVQAIMPIPLYQTFAREVREEQNPARQRVKPAEKKEKMSPLAISVWVNVLLGIAVAAMFIITLKSDQPNILNYETAITNRYASWEQELTEREQVIREKERELKIEAE